MKVMNTIVKIALGMGLMLLASPADVNAADTATVAKVLIDFDEKKPPVEVETNNVKVSTVKKPDGAALRVASVPR